MTPLTTAAKHRQSRASSYVARRQSWRAEVPSLELNDAGIELDDIPTPYPPCKRTVDSIGIVERQGVAVIVPSPFISKPVNRRAERFWRSQGFEKRDVDNTPHVCVETYVVEWVRLLSPADVEAYSIKAWLKAATLKHKELYQ